MRIEQTVLLECGTVGILFDNYFEIGEIATVNLHDENGMPIQVTGKISEIF